MKVKIFEMRKDVLESVFGDVQSGFSLEQYEDEFGTRVIDLREYEVVLEGEWNIEEDYESVEDFLQELHDDCIDTEECIYSNYRGRGMDLGNVIMVGNEYYFVDRVGFEKVRVFNQ